MSKRDNRDNRKNDRAKEAPEYDQRVIDLARVTRVMAGGKRMRFRALVAIGDHAGRFGVGLAKGADVTLAVNKAVNKAKKNILTIPFYNETIPHEVRIKYKAAKIMLKPAPRGTGIKAGGAMRVLCELAGVPNVVGKIIGSSNNKVSIVNALVKAVQQFKARPAIAKKVKSAKTEKANVESTPMEENK